MGRSMLAIAWAVLVGAAGFAAANLASGEPPFELDSVRGLFFFGPLGSIIGYVAAERAMKKAGGLSASVLGGMVLVTVVYGLLVLGGVLFMRR